MPRPNNGPPQPASFSVFGAQPDRAAAARGAPLFQQNCAFCHGPQARGAEGPSLITSDVVLGDDHGEHLVPFLKKGRPEKGMPSFASVSDDQLKDIAEFLHLQVEDVANRGAYHVLNILVGDPAKGQAYVAANCMSCHTAGNVRAYRKQVPLPRPTAARLDLADASRRQFACHHRDGEDGGRRHVSPAASPRSAISASRWWTATGETPCHRPRDPEWTVEMKDPLAAAPGDDR